jgi:hypothetical protein
VKTIKVRTERQRRAIARGKYRAWFAALPLDVKVRIMRTHADSIAEASLRMMEDDLASIFTGVAEAR